MKKWLFLLLLIVPGIAMASESSNPASTKTLVSYSSAAVSYLGISSTTAPAPDDLTKSSASVSYTGISTFTALASSMSVSYTGISTYTALTSSLTAVYLQNAAAATTYMLLTASPTFNQALLQTSSFTALTSSLTAVYLQNTAAATMYMLLTASPTFNQALTQLSSFTAFNSSMTANYLQIPDATTTYLLKTTSATFNQALTQLSSFTAFGSSMTAFYLQNTAAATNYMLLTASATFNQTLLQISSAPQKINLGNTVNGTLPIANLTTNASSYWQYPSSGTFQVPAIISTGTINVLNSSFTTNNFPVGLTISSYSNTGAGLMRITTSTGTVGGVGTSSTTITLTSSGTFVLTGQAQVFCSSCAFTAVSTMSFEIYRQNNIGGMVANTYFPVVLSTGANIPIDVGYCQTPYTVYATTNTNDVLSLQAVVSANPITGVLKAIWAALSATRIY